MHSVCCGGQTGRTSIDIVCHVASNSLCPSNRLDIPAFPLHGVNLRNGVKFSVHTTSRGSAPCSKCKVSADVFAWSPSGSKVMTGRLVRVESMKFIEAQNRPARALLSVIHRAKALKNRFHEHVCTLSYLKCTCACFNAHSLVLRVRLNPCPCLNAGAALFYSVPGPCAPALGVPSPGAKAQM